MSPQGLIVQENLETDTVVPASVKTPSSVKELKSVTNSPGKKSGSDKDQRQIRELKKNSRADGRSNGSPLELKLLHKALGEIETFHSGQSRRSGQPVIIHPLRVAWQICEVGLDPSTVVAALLHDAVEDTPMTLEHIDQKYGAWYAQIAVSYTHLTLPTR